MSMTYTMLEDQLMMLVESATSEQDPIIRLKHLRRLKKEGLKHLRKAERKAAYDARMAFSWTDIAEALQVDRKELEYLVSVYLVDNPEKPAPKKRQRVDISNYLDLSGK
jgi:hypothetical protein